MFSFSKRPANPTADAAQLVTSYQTHWTALSKELEDANAERAVVEAALEPTAHALRDAQDQLNHQRVTLSNTLASVERLQALATMKEAAAAKVAEQVEAQRAEVAAVEAEAARDESRFVQASEALQRELSDLRERYAAAHTQADAMTE